MAFGRCETTPARFGRLPSCCTGSDGSSGLRWAAAIRCPREWLHQRQPRKCANNRKWMNQGERPKIVPLPQNQVRVTGERKIDRSFGEGPQSREHQILACFLRAESR